MALCKSFIALPILLLLCIHLTRAQEGNIDIVPISYDGLKQEVVKHRGKVLIVDFWQSVCIPCRKAFPHFVDMHKKYGDKGLVVITVSVDSPPDNQNKVESAAAFLRQANSPFRNLVLNDPVDSWMKKLPIETLPCYYIFDRHGKWVRFGGTSDSSVNYEKLEDAVVQMLNEK